MTAPKFDECYCGCPEPTKGHFATEGGHDSRAASMLHFLKWGTTDMATILREEGFAPDMRNLTEEAERAGWKKKTPRAS
jgi:hypothetical protein